MVFGEFAALPDFERKRNRSNHIIFNGIMSGKTYRYKKVRSETRLSDVSVSSDEEGCDSYYVLETEESKGFSTMEDRQISTFSVSMFLLICIFVPGFYTLQRSFAYIGWYAILAGIVVITVLCYTSILLSRTQDKMTRNEPSAAGRRDIYPFIVEVSLGRFAGTIFIVLFNILLMCVAVSVLTYMTDSLRRLMPNALPSSTISVENQMRLWCILVVMLVLPLTILDSPKSYWFIGNGCGVLSLLTVCIVVSILVSNLINGARYTGPARLKSNNFDSFVSVCSYISLMIFTFGFHPYLPTLQLDCNKPRYIPGALLATSLIGAFCFLVCSSLAYGVFGTDISSNLFDNLYLHESTTVSTIDYTLVRVCSVLMLVQGIVAYSIAVTPLNNVAETLLGHIDWDSSFALRIAIRIATTVIIASISILLPHFVPILVVTSGLLLSVFDVILPIVCYSVYTDSNMGFLHHSFHALIVIATVVCSTFAIYETGRNLFLYMAGRQRPY